MSNVLHRALPFVIAFILGVACTAVVRSILPTQRKTFQYNGRPRCREKLKDFSTGRFIPVQKGTPVLDVIEMPDTATVIRSQVTLSSNNAVSESGLTLKEQALLASASRPKLVSSRGGVIVSYVSPDNIDGNLVTSDAVLSHIPHPWLLRHEQNSRLALECNAIVRVNLDSSGTVSTVQKIPGYADGCPYLGDILDAARNISFQPAMRDGIRVSQRLSVMYRLR